jgi:hypothetical protein
MRKLTLTLQLLLCLALPLQALAGMSPCMFEDHGQMDHSMHQHHNCCPDQGQQDDAHNQSCDCDQLIQASAVSTTIYQGNHLAAIEPLMLRLSAYPRLNYPPVKPPQIG